MDNNSSLKLLYTPFIESKFKLNNLLNVQKIKVRSINTAKLVKNKAKYKDFFYEKRKQLMNKTQKERFFSSRNKRTTILSRKHKINSLHFYHPRDTQRSLLSSFMNKSTKSDKKTNTLFKSSFSYKKNIKTKRNVSAYYINSKINLKQNYISDLIHQKETIQNNSQKISDIEKRINLLQKKLGFQSPKKTDTILILQSKGVSTREKEEEKNEKEKNLPDYLKEEFNIKGTNILSPFCKKSRDNFIMEKFRKFLNKAKNLKSDKKYLVDNKLNIVYAENEEMYMNKLKKINNSLIKKGKRERFKFILSPSEKQLREMEKEVTFMKDIVECAFPNTALMRLRDNKEYFRKNKTFYKKFESMDNKKEKEYKNDYYVIKIK